ncbi:tlde1 domain-containing protein [Taylorella equigenitalis]|uniref:tlde1 domain-containing protein n=1 Tax=Taylorella equigenitalis TaxID=29575 RepID=UPI0009D6453A|nr:tlde1 domain-containing protein [Taylorella equigenitalis]ASY41226.1 hypothetical protein CAV20_06110 [Taylorella equigenitalis]WDU49134.1 DUF2778 domain-containing protein [Taylorella equigenitalis]WDU53117.1 DUF2778 domain-containing protein [Taylorella equigenitalis]WDU56101.1 DUF2778 domain-containing protein [Taylorella equigenitalis]
MWFALLRIDEKLDDQTIYNSQVRSLFRLYPRVGAGESWGCITLLNLSDFYVLHFHIIDFNLGKSLGVDYLIHP